MRPIAHVEARVEARRERFPIPKLEALVSRFYGRVQQDELLAPVFEKRIDDWPHHLGRMVDFWRAVLRAEPTFRPNPRGGPPAMHQAIEELELGLFHRWLALFGEVSAEIFEPAEAEEVRQAAQRMAVALSAHLHPDVAHKRRLRI